MNNKNDNKLRYNILIAIVYIIGGATYAEHCVVTALSDNTHDIILGGSFIHNAQTFIENEILPYG